MRNLKMNIYIKQRGKNNNIQNFMQQFVESCIKYGFKKKRTYKFPTFILNFLETIHLFYSKYILHLKPPQKAILITAYGDTLFLDSIPYIFNYKIIPMLWDVWPSRWNSIYYYLKLFKCPIIFCTVAEFAKQIETDLGIKAYWVPEGIDISLYQKGDILENRQIDIYELGRQNKKYHDILEDLHLKGIIKDYYRNIYFPDGTYQLAFKTTSEFIEKLSTIKIVISFPCTDTHPTKAGNLETLTQRYWECMLSRCLIVGRAPKELIKIIGYDPVINVDWNNPTAQCVQILKNIGSYQNLVDKNYITALQYASWDTRAEYVKKILLDNGYNI